MTIEQIRSEWHELKMSAREVGGMIQEDIDFQARTVEVSFFCGGISFCVTETTSSDSPISEETIQDMRALIEIARRRKVKICAP